MIYRRALSQGSQIPPLSFNLIDLIGIVLPTVTASLGDVLLPTKLN